MGADRVQKVLIVDDHPIFRDGLKLHLKRHSGFSVCGEASGVQDAVALTRELRPDLALVDLRLPDGHGLDLIRKAKAIHRGIKFLVISVYDESIYGERSLRAGAAGYICKTEVGDTLLSALELVAAGKIYASADVTQRLLVPNGNRNDRASPIDPLTDRELQIFELLGKGLTTRDIAERLHLSASTIDTHRERIKRKLGLHSGNELIRFAAQWAMQDGEVGLT